MAAAKSIVPGTGESRRGVQVLGTGRTRRDVEALRAFYERWQWLPNLDFDYFLDVLLAQPQSVRPHVIALGNGSEPEALAVGRIVDKNLPLRIGNKTFMQNTVRVLQFPRGGLLGDERLLASPQFMDAVLGSLAADDAEFAEFSTLDAQSALFGDALRKPQRLCRDAFVGVSHGWILDLPPSYEAFLKQRSSKTRYYLNNTVRKFESQYAGRYAVKLFARPDELDDALAAVEQVAQETFQRRLGVGFSRSPEVLGFLELAAERGWLNAQVAYIDGEPVAFGLGYRYKDQFFAEYTGFNRRFQKSSPGIYLMAQLVRELCEQGSVTRLHWGVGKEDYKARLSTRSIPSADVYIAAPRLKSIRIHCTRLALKSSAAGAKWMAERVGLKDWAQRQWKGVLRGRGTTPPPS